MNGVPALVEIRACWLRGNYYASKRLGEKPHIALTSLGKSAHSLHFSEFLFKFLERVLLFHDFQLEVQFLSAEDRRQVKLPKFSRKAQMWPALIEVN
jgi:hypothetical protein